jgi:hypothetical protein
VYSVENASPVVGSVPESNSLAPSESNSQRNNPELETANVLVKCLNNCRYLSNTPRLFKRLLREQSGGLYRTLEGWWFVLITRDIKTVQRNVTDRREKSEERSGVRIVF